MGRLNEKGLQRLVNNIKKDVDARIDIVDSELGATKNNVTTIENYIDVLKEKTVSYDNVVSNFKNILFSTDLPTDNEGNDGDIWIKYIQE